VGGSELYSVAHYTCACGTAISVTTTTTSSSSSSSNIQVVGAAVLCAVGWVAPHLSSCSASTLPPPSASVGGSDNARQQLTRGTQADTDTDTDTNADPLTADSSRCRVLHYGAREPTLTLALTLTC
jgi:hypothetical protein